MAKKFDEKKELDELAENSLAKPVRIQIHIHEQTLTSQDRDLLEEAAKRAIATAKTNREVIQEIAKWAKLIAKAMA